MRTLILTLVVALLGAHAIDASALQWKGRRQSNNVEDVRYLHPDPSSVLSYESRVKEFVAARKILVSIGKKYPTGASPFDCNALKSLKAQYAGLQKDLTSKEMDTAEANLRSLTARLNAIGAKPPSLDKTDICSGGLDSALTTIDQAETQVRSTMRAISQPFTDTNSKVKSLVGLLKTGSPGHTDPQKAALCEKAADQLSRQLQRYRIALAKVEDSLSKNQTRLRQYSSNLLQAQGSCSTGTDSNISDGATDSFPDIDTGTPSTASTWTETGTQK